LTDPSNRAHSDTRSPPTIGFALFRTFALALGALALLLLVLLGGLPSRTEAVAVFNNAGHAPIFGMLAWIVLHLLSGGQSRTWRHYVMAFGITTLAGVLVEVVQSFIGRDAEGGDVLMDASGAAFALCVTAGWTTHTSHDAGHDTPPVRDIRFWSLIVLAVVAAGIVAAPLIRTARAYAERRAAFPELARFDRPLGVYFLREHDLEARRRLIPAPYAVGPKEPGLRIEILRPAIPGFMLVEPAPDWRGYHSLKFDVINPGHSPVTLILRIHDRWHDQRPEDRFNRVYVIEAHTRGTVEVSLSDIARAPRDRPFDLSQVAGVGLFQPTGTAVPGTIFYIAHLRLE
jgi:hypothetical protein